MVEMEASSESERSENSENSSSDEPKTPENEATDYEKQRELRISQNKAKMEAMGLQKIVNSVVDWAGKGKSQLKSKRVSKKGEEDDEYEPDEEDQEDDASDRSMNCSSEEFDEDEEEKHKKKKKKVANSRSSGSASGKFTGYCGEKICLKFPKAPDEEVKKLMDSYPKGFNGFDCEESEKVLRWIASLKEDYWKLRRSHMRYPNFRKKVVEGLPLPEGFNGFNFEESKQISGVIVALEEAYSSLRNFIQSDVHEGAKGLQLSVHHEASVSHALETSFPPTTQVSGSQQRAPTFDVSPVQSNVPMLPHRFPGSHPSIHHKASGSQPLETSCPPTTQVSGPQQKASTFEASPVQSNAHMLPYRFRGSHPSTYHEVSGSHPLKTSCPPATQVSGSQQQASTSDAGPVQLNVPMLSNRFPGSHPSMHHEASGSHLMETSCPPTPRVSGPQQQASTFDASPVQSDVPMFPSKFPGYRQFPPNWYPSMGPYGMAPSPWNPYNANYPPPSMGNYPGMPYFGAGMRPFPPWHS